ncbi:MAG: hypothetical protein ACM3ZQ_08360 [Bacillota bacterium]
MRTKLAAIGETLFISLALAGCQVKVVQPMPSVPAPSASTPTSPAPQPTAAQPPTAVPATETKLTKTGVYFGLADTHTIEVSIDGKPTALQISDTIKQRLEELKLKKDDKIELTYYLNDSKQLVITALQKAK